MFRLPAGGGAWHNRNGVQLDFIYFDAGGGHRAAADALHRVIGQQQRPWEVRLVNLQEVLDELDLFRKLTGLRLQDIYNLMLKKGWTLGSPQLTAGMHVIIRLFHSAQVRLLRALWEKRRPDMVVSLVRTRRPDRHLYVLQQGGLSLFMIP